MNRSRWAVGLKWTAEILLGGFCLFWMLFGIGEIASGDWSGIMHIAPAVMLAIMLVIGWKWPRAAGIMLLLLGLTVSANYYSGFATMEQRITAILLTGAPMFVLGLLLSIAGWLYLPGNRPRPSA